MNILVISGAPLFYGVLFAKALDRDGHTVRLFSPHPNSRYHYSLPEGDVEKYVIDGVGMDINQYDVIFGCDHGVLSSLFNIKQRYPDKIVGVQVLDYPKHVFRKNKDYNESVAMRWEGEYKIPLKYMDFVLHNKMDALESLSHLTEKAVVDYFRYPVNPHPVSGDFRGDYIVYSGRLAPDKGVYNVISALALLEDDIEFVTIGSGYDYSSFAEHLHVRYRNIGDCSEAEKWQYYHDCRFTVCGAENPYITALCILEGISIGRSGVVFQSDENQFHYKGRVAYAGPGDIKKLAETISFMYHNPKTADQLVEEGPKFYEEECSYEAWGRKIHSMIEKVNLE